MKVYTEGKSKDTVKFQILKIIICLCMSKVHQKNSFLHVFTQTLNIKTQNKFFTNSQI